MKWRYSIHTAGEAAGIKNTGNGGCGWMSWEDAIALRSTLQMYSDMI